MSKTIIIKSVPENLRQVEKFIDEISEELGLSDEIYGNLLIATLEGTNNAIIHGNKKSADKEVVIFFESDEKKLCITIKDEGPGFDYKAIPDPTSPENIEKVNGRGVFLMERLSDELEFKSNGAEIKLTFNIDI